MIKRIAIIALVGLSLAGVILYRNLSADFREGSGTPAAEFYTCPMHPSVRSGRPGACPVCGMALVKKSALDAMNGVDTAGVSDVTLSPVQRVVANVTTIPVRRQALLREIRAAGVVDIAEPLQATVAARFRGRIEKLRVTSSGQPVRKGEPLLELYSPDLITAEQEFLLALEATESAGPAGTLALTGKRLLDAARERLRIHFGMSEAQISRLEQTRTVRRTASFNSPISGTVLEKDVQEGQFVDEGMVLYRLANLSRVWIILDVYEQNLRFVSVGSEVLVTSGSYPGDGFTAKVLFIDPVVNKENRTVRVRLETPNPSGKLKPNMYVEGTIKTLLPPSLVVPSQAVLVTGNRSVVWVETAENRFTPRWVTTGVTSEGLTEILTGLREGDRIAATGGFLIDSESALSAPVGGKP